MRKMLLLLLAVCAPAGAQEAASGVAGAVRLNHVCRGPQSAGDACSAPYPNAELQLLDKSGNVLARTISDAQGRFQLAVAAGRYRLHVAVEGAYPRCTDLVLTVRRQRLSTVALECDSGMR